VPDSATRAQRITATSNRRNLFASKRKRRLARYVRKGNNRIGLGITGTMQK
jgi:hypothetical protein